MSETIISLWWEKTSISVHYFWRLYHDCYCIYSGGLIWGEDQHISALFLASISWLSLHLFWGTNSGRRPAYQCSISGIHLMIVMWLPSSAVCSQAGIPCRPKPPSWPFPGPIWQTVIPVTQTLIYSSWASLSRAVSTVAAFLHFTMLYTVPNQSLHLTVIQVTSLSLILSYEICQLHDRS